MPIQKLIQGALPFMAGGAVAIFVAELTRTPASASRNDSFPDRWYQEVERAPEHLWTGEPVFDWGD